MVNGDVIKLKYPEIVSDNYRCRGEVYNHNELRHDGGTKNQIGLESIYVITWMTIRVFDLFIAYTEVNVYLELKYLLKADENFTKLKNGKAFILNSYIRLSQRY